MAEQNTNKKPNIFKRFFAWLRTVKAELKKISWTPADALRKNVIMSLVVMIVLAAATGIVDFIFSKFIFVIGQIL